MKIKTAFVLLALVAFVALLQSADAFGGAQNEQEARKKHKQTQTNNENPLPSFGIGCCCCIVSTLC
jgi:hypothetical protein